MSVAKFMTGVVGLHLPNGALWHGRYNMGLRRIEGLEELMKQYNVKSYHLLAFMYYGGTEFGLQIFNHYAVEINYSSPVQNLGNDALSVIDSSFKYDNMMEENEYEKDKMHACFGFNAYTTFSAEYLIVTTYEHLVTKDWTMVSKLNFSSLLFDSV